MPGTAQYTQMAMEHVFSSRGQSADAGSIGSARNLEGLKKRGITHVLNASPVVPRFHKRHFSYMTIHVYDDAEEDITRFFHQAACFIARVSAEFFRDRLSSQGEVCEGVTCDMGLYQA